MVLMRQQYGTNMLVEQTSMTIICTENGKSTRWDITWHNALGYKNEC